MRVLDREPQRLCEPGGATGQIDNFANQIRIDLIRKLGEIHIDIVKLRPQFRSVVVSKVSGIEMLEVGAGLKLCASSLRHLFAVHREEAVNVDEFGE